MTPIDLSKLTPAPWSVRESESHRGKWILADANDEYLGTFEMKDVAERVALARNAFDVMMWREWNEMAWALGCLRQEDDSRQRILLFRQRSF